MLGRYLVSGGEMLAIARRGFQLQISDLKVFVLIGSIGEKVADSAHEMTMKKARGEWEERKKKEMETKKIVREEGTTGQRK